MKNITFGQVDCLRDALDKIVSEERDGVLTFHSFYDLVPKFEEIGSSLTLSCVWKNKGCEAKYSGGKFDLFSKDVECNLLINSVSGIFDKENHGQISFLCEEVLTLFNLCKFKRDGKWSASPKSDFVSRNVDKDLFRILRNDDTNVKDESCQRENLDFVDKWWLLCKDAVDDLDLHDCFAALVESLESRLHIPKVILISHHYVNSYSSTRSTPITTLPLPGQFLIVVWRMKI